MDNISLEDIDFDAVGKCNDPKILTKYIQLLKADGGYFQELLKACEDRLIAVDPKTAQKVLPPKTSPQCVDEARQLLLQWETELRSSATNEPTPSENSAPVRNSRPGVTARKVESKSAEAVRKSETPYKRDGTKMKQYYDAWDKMDVDLTLQEQDEAERQKNAELKRKQDEFAAGEYPELDESTALSDPAVEVTKGLEALRAGDAEEAEYFFSRSIQAAGGRHARGFFHRAEARTALQKHREALEDIQTALALDSALGAAGGFSIRANLRAEAGFLADAEADFLKALEVAKSSGDSAAVEKIDRQLRLVKSKRTEQEKKSKPEVFTKISIVEVDEEEPEEPKIVEIFSDDEEVADKKPKETFTKVSIIEESAEPNRRRVPVQIVDDEDEDLHLPS